MVKVPDEKIANDLARQIGALILNFSGFENTLNITLAAAFNLSASQERSLIRPIQPRAKLELLEAFAKRHWTPEACTAVKSLTAQAKPVVNFRNGLAHGLIVHNAEGEFHLATFKGEDRFDGRVEPLTVEKVGHFLTEAIRLSALLETVAQAVDAERQKLLAEKHGKHPAK